MPQPSRTTLLVTGGIAAAALVAAGTAAASSGSPTVSWKAAVNANTLNGYHAKDLARTYFASNTNSVDNFDVCTFTTKLTQVVNVPVAGYVSVTGGVGAARDTDYPDPAELVIRLVKGGKAISAERATQLATDGSYDGNVTVQGYAPVKKGRNLIKLQMEECGDGTTAAFITDRTISTVFTPFGTSRIVTSRPVTRNTNR